MLNRREFLSVLSCAAASAAPGLSLATALRSPAQAAAALYESATFGNVHLMHMTDCHAQLLPLVYREPHANIGVGAATNQPPHLVGQALLNRFNLKPNTALAHAFTHLQFEQGVRQFGRVGGFAHLTTLVKQLKATRPNALLLDGGDTWQGSGTSLWTRGLDMVRACKLLGVDVMTLHWEATYGAQRVEELIAAELKGKVDVVAQNIKTQDFGDQVFAPYVIREINGVPVAIVGQAFPYTPIANPRYFTPDWTYGIQEESLQKQVNAARAAGAKAVILLSHNGMDVDLKLASRVTGIDAIMGGHTHDGVPAAIPVRNASGTTLVTNAGSHGKFLGLLELDVKDGAVKDYRYRLLPVFSNLLAPDQAMQALIDEVRKPYAQQLAQPLARTQGTLYRRGNFNGTFDQLICDALMQGLDAPIAFSPGFRWGSSLLPNSTITLEDVMNHTAITYPTTYANEMTGTQIKEVLEDVADNLFNPDPYLQQGGDMVRVSGLTYSLAPLEKTGARISDLRLKGQPLHADKRYKVAGWASVNEQTQRAGGKPVWEVVQTYLQDRKVIGPIKPQAPRIIGLGPNQGLV